jgi:hypothetical protein
MKKNMTRRAWKASAFRTGLSAEEQVELPRSHGVFRAFGLKRFDGLRAGGQGLAQQRCQG